MNRRWIIPFLLFIFIVTGIWGVLQYREKELYHAHMQNQYHRMFYELLNNVENIQVDLSKVLVSDSIEHNRELFMNVSRQSFSAQEKLNQLPITHSSLNETSKFLTQTADYCCSVGKKAERLNPDNIKNIDELHDNAVQLTGELKTLFHKIADGDMDLSRPKKRIDMGIIKPPNKTLDDEFLKVHEKMTEYPTLIYDGPFSEHLLEGKPKEIKGPRIKFDDGKKIARDFIGNERIKEIRRGNDGSGFVKTIGLEIILKGNEDSPIYMDITETGGHIAWMLNNRKINRKRLSIEEVVKKAELFMKEKGFEDMVATFSMLSDGAGVVNFAGTENGVILYPDLIKVKVALDNGEIVGWEAQQYLMAHHTREIKKPKLTERECQKYINGAVKTKKGRLCLIPTDDGKEVLTYEYEGNYNDDDFLIYINADNGNEEKILKLIKSKNGTLTI